MKRVPPEAVVNERCKRQKKELIIRDVLAFATDFKNFKTNQKEIDDSYETFCNYFEYKLEVVNAVAFQKLLARMEYLEDQLELKNDFQELTKQDEKNKTS
jgi:hypothetical protein